MSESGVGDINTLEARMMKMNPTINQLQRESSSTFVGSMRPNDSGLVEDTTNNLMVSKELRMMKPKTFKV